MIPYLALLVPAAIFGATIGLFLWVGRRHFYRTNAAGVEEFKNYRSAVLSGFIEWVAMVLGLLLILPGLSSVVWVISLFMKSNH